MKAKVLLKRGFVALGLILLVVAGYLIQQVVSTVHYNLAMQGYNSCLQQVVSQVESTGTFQIDVSNGEQEGVVVLVPLTQEPDGDQ